MVTCNGIPVYRAYLVLQGGPYRTAVFYLSSGVQAGRIHRLGEQFDKPSLDDLRDQGHGAGHRQRAVYDQSRAGSSRIFINTNTVNRHL